MAIQQPAPTYADVIIEEGGRKTFNPIWLRWFIDIIGSVDGTVFDLSALEAEIAALTHNGLPGLQGGQTSEYFHFKSADYTDLTDGGSSALHFHSTDRDLANATGIASVPHGGSGAAILTGYLKGNGTSAFTASASIPSTDVTGLPIYTTGTFTPIILGSTTAGATTYSVQKGNYTRIGDRVIFNLHVTWSAASGTGNLLVGGLPVTSNSTSNTESVFSVQTNLALALQSSYLARLAVNSTQLVLESYAVAAGVAAVAVQGSGDLIISGSYLI